MPSLPPAHAPSVKESASAPRPNGLVDHADQEVPTLTDEPAGVTDLHVKLDVGAGADGAGQSSNELFKAAVAAMKLAAVAEDHRKRAPQDWRLLGEACVAHEVAVAALQRAMTSAGIAAKVQAALRGKLTVVEDNLTTLYLARSLLDRQGQPVYNIPEPAAGSADAIAAEPVAEPVVAPESERKLEPEPAPAAGLPAVGSLMRALKAPPVRVALAESSARSGNLRKGEEFKVLEAAVSPETGEARVRLSKGWVSLASKSGIPLAEPMAGVEGAAPSHAAVDAGSLAPRPPGMDLRLLRSIKFLKPVLPFPTPFPPAVHHAALACRTGRVSAAWR